MPAALTKEELLEVTAKELDELERLLTGIDRETALGKDDEDTSIKDTVERYNADLRAAQSDLGWDDACGLLRRSHAELVGFLEAHTNEDLYSGPMAGANNNWTPGRWAEAAGPSHYRSASKYIRSRLRATR